MRQLAPDVWQLSGFPPNAFNVYVIGDVLIDAGTRWAERRIERQLTARPRMLALTHVHPDHQGSAHALCRRWDIPLACHEADAPVMAGRRRMQPDNFVMRCSKRLFAGPTWPVDRHLAEGDELAGFRVLHTPGHTAGHVALFRERDRVAIIGDVLNGMHLLTMWPGLHEPPRYFSTDWAENRRSIQRVAELEPRLLLFGHGPPCHDMLAFQRFAKRLGE
jgi:glyoxylase-like metal-dependent hydrolase (beta-lactamase superfamily II)